MHFGRWGLPREIISLLKQFHFVSLKGIPIVITHMQSHNALQKNLNAISTTFMQKFN